MQAGTDIDLATNDLGPLAWVLDELRKSLDGASAALRRFVRDTTLARGTDMASVDAGQLRIARQQLHQAVGALEMVGLPAPALVLRSMEAAVQKFVDRPELCSEQAAAKVERAGFALTEYLEGVLLDKAPSAVALYPQYKDTQEIAGADRVHPADLWTPEWRWHEPQTGAPADAQHYAPAVRTRLDQAVLKLVKSGDAEAARELSRLSLGLAAAQEARQPRIFWKVCAGFFEAVGQGLLPLDVYVKRAGSRILLQYASLAKGELGVSDRLVQDLVFFCSQAVPGTPFDAPALTAVRHAWNLGAARPVDYTVAQYGRFDPVLLSQARKRIAIARETWAALSGGDANKLKSVADQFHAVGDSLVKLHPASAPLSHAIAAIVDAVVRTARAPAAEIAMEVATAVLYLEAAFEDLDPADSQLADRTARLAERLEKVRQGGQPEALEPWMEELYRRVSDRQTMGSVVGELRGALGEVEKLLDQYFRDLQDKSPLRDAPMHLQQMRGVLSVLGLDQAAHAVQRMRDAVEEIIVTEIDEEKARAAGTFDKLGNSLGALGFLIDMLNYQPALAKKLFVFDEDAGELRPLMGRAAQPLPEPGESPAPGLAHQVDAVASSLQATGARPQVSQQLEAIATRAALEEQSAIAESAREAAAVVAQDPAASAAALQQLASVVRPAASDPAPAAAAEPDFEEDELLGIFLEEAREVVQNGLAAIEALAAAPTDQNELTTLRRAFHTLKGSSRMVGLTEFGEAAWSLEQVLNTWLADQKPASDELRGLAREAMQAFGQWAEDIAAQRDRGWRAAMFRAPADALRLQGQLVPFGFPAGGVSAAAEAPGASEGSQTGPAHQPADLIDADGPQEASAVAIELTLPNAEPAGIELTLSDAEPAGDEASPAALETPAAASVEIDFDLPGLSAEPFAAQSADAREPVTQAAMPEPAAMQLAVDAVSDIELPAAEFSFELPDPSPAEELSAAEDAGQPPQPMADAELSFELPSSEPSFELPELPPGEDPVEAAPQPVVVDLASMDLPSLELGETAQETPELSAAGMLERAPAAADTLDAEGAAVAGPLQAIEGESRQASERAPQEAIDAASQQVVEWAIDDLPAGFAAELEVPLSPAGNATSTEIDSASVDLEPVGAQAATHAAAVEESVSEFVEDSAEDTAAAQPLVPASAHDGAEPVPDAAEPTPASAETDDQIKVIGSLRIGIPLYNVYLNEADEWSRRLATELAEWALESGEPIADSTVGLAHALAGSSATVGFHGLSDVARSLEGALMHAQRLAYGTPQHARAFNDAADEIRRLLHQFAAGFLKEPHPAVVAGLESLKLLDIPARADFVETPFDELDELELEDAQRDVLHADATRPGHGDASHGSVDVDTAEGQAAPAPEPATKVTPLFGAMPPARPQPVLHAIENDGADDLDVVDAVDAELFGIFEEEALELLPHLGSALRQWAARPENRGARDQVLRTLHTLKGSARLAGALRLGELAHRMESDVEALGSEVVSASDIEPLLQRFDSIQANFDTLRARGAASAQIVPAAESRPASAANEQEQGRELPAEPVGSAAAVPAPEAAGDPGAPAQRGTIARPATLSLAQQRASATQSVRVRSHLLDRLMNQAGEVMITRTRLESELRQLRAALGDLTGNLDRLRTQLRDIELQAETQMQSRLALAKDSAAGFDPLEFDRFTRVQELTRMMAESVNDVATVQRTIQRTVEATEDDLVMQARLTRELQRDLLRTRMVEFEGIADRLYRVVRLASKETGKQVKLDILGGSIEMDRGVLDRMTPAFEHLLRNCVAHGIEDPAARAAAGKEAAGNIVIDLRQEGNDVSVEFRDDGAGLDLARIRHKAVQQGLVPADQALGDDEAAQLIFMPGFSTAAQVTELAGRGIGMDVVRAEVNALGGRIETQSHAGQGTSFRLVLPLTTAVTQVVMLRAGSLSIGVPANLVEMVRRTGAGELEQAYADGSYAFQGEPIPFYWCGALLQSSARSSEMSGKTLPVVVLRSAAQRMALHVDEVLGNQEVVVKNLGPQLSRLPGLAGMTVLASGAVVLIYNPVALGSVYGEQARRLHGQQAQPQGSAVDAGNAATGAGASSEASQVPLVLVVDDSITVRRVTQRLLQREGYRVALAADGLQALEKLAEERPAVVLSDIEMPRMDGFDLARNIRADARLKDLPIVMITSRIAEKHREHARELGVDHYLGKPYSEEGLLGLLRHYCAAAAAA